LYVIETQPVWTMHDNARSELWARLVDGSSVRVQKMYDKKAVRAMEREFERLLGIEDAKVFLPPPRGLRLREEGDGVSICRRPTNGFVWGLAIFTFILSLPFLWAVWSLVSDPAGFVSFIRDMMNSPAGSNGENFPYERFIVGISLVAVVFFIWVAPLYILFRLFLYPARILMMPEQMDIRWFGEPGPHEGNSGWHQKPTIIELLGTAGRFLFGKPIERSVSVEKEMSVTFFEWRYWHLDIDVGVKDEDKTLEGERDVYYDVVLKVPGQKYPEFVARTRDVMEARFICQEIGRYYGIPWGIEVEDKRSFGVEFV